MDFVKPDDTAAVAGAGGRIFTSRVTLPMQGTVAELLVKLLGQEPMAVCALDKRRDGVLELGLN